MTPGQALWEKKQELEQYYCTGTWSGTPARIQQQYEALAQAAIDCQIRNQKIESWNARIDRVAAASQPKPEVKTTWAIRLRKTCWYFGHDEHGFITGDKCQRFKFTDKRSAVIEFTQVRDKCHGAKLVRITRKVKK